MTPGTRSAIVLRCLERLGPTTPDALCDVLADRMPAHAVLSSVVSLVCVGRVLRRHDGRYAPHRIR